MGQDSADLADFLTRVETVLQETGDALLNLSRAAFLQYSRLVDDAGRAAPPHLEEIGRQLLDLSERSEYLRRTVRDAGRPLLFDSEAWPRVKILQSHEEERGQIARVLENGVGQLLANTVFEVASYRQLFSQVSSTADESQPLLEGLAQLQLELEEGLSDFRRFIIELDPSSVLGNLGLGAGVRRYLEKFERRSALKTELRVNANFGRLPTLVEVAIFRVIQEALHNALSHANASRVEVIFEEVDGDLLFSVIDDGDGIRVENLQCGRRRFGLARMMDYAELLNGRLRLFSEPGQGTCVVLSVPYPTVTI